MTFAVDQERTARIQAITWRMLREPFTVRAWAELAFFLLGSALAGVAFFIAGATMALGVLLAITFFGVAILVLSLRFARGAGGIQRQLFRSVLGESIQDPASFLGRPGFLGWLQSHLRDRVAWRALAYLFLRVPLAIVGFIAAVSLWWDALACLLSLIDVENPAGGPRVFALGRTLFPSGYFSEGPFGFFHRVSFILIGALFLFAAPWVTRVFVTVDRFLIRSLLGPDPVATRVRSLEEARTQTVDASAATLRRIERDLHDGTQAQLVALAMRLGMAKEKLDDVDRLDDVGLHRVRELVEEAHRGAKEAIAELRDIARGIHPPVLDVGLEGAFATLAARSPVATEVSVDLRLRPTPAIEAIAYFCAAELLANVAQHARASRASVTCAQQGTWLRLAVRDDGHGGAHVATLGSTSSGLAGLAERVHGVDGQLNLVSPPGGPTVVTVDLPLRA
jgi:signal transduction histidine kinase